MPTKMSLAEQLLYAVTKITAFEHGKPFQVGTGFFYRHRTEHGDLIILITNKHVVHREIDGRLRKADEVRGRSHLSTPGDPFVPSGETVEWSIRLGPDVCSHPLEDLCALPFDHVIIEAEESKKQLLIPFFGADLIPTDAQWQSFEALERVLMVGCPRGLYDDVNNIPIFRSGFTASPLSKRWQGKSQFMVDMACFQGSSGSPVLLLNSDPYVNQDGSLTIAGGERKFLLGVLFEGPLYAADGTIILGETPYVRTALPMHLGFVMRSTAILELCEVAVAEASRNGPISVSVG